MHETKIGFLPSIVNRCFVWPCLCFFALYYFHAFRGNSEGSRYVFASSTLLTQSRRGRGEKHRTKGNHETYTEDVASFEKQHACAMVCILLASLLFDEGFPRLFLLFSTLSGGHSKYPHVKIVYYLYPRLVVVRLYFDNTVRVLNVIWLSRVTRLLDILGVVRRASGLLRQLWLRRDCLRLLVVGRAPGLLLGELLWLRHGFLADVSPFLRFKTRD